MAKISSGRRRFLKSVAGGATAGLAAGALPAIAQTSATSTAPDTPPVPAAAETLPVDTDPAFLIKRPGADFMVDVIKSLGIEYIAANPGSSFRGLHESIINYGGNKKPEFLTCLHEETSVGIAHGYARASGKTMACMMHSTVGVQHAAMGIYNAFADRAPVLMFTAASVDAALRRPFAEWVHAVQDGAALVRDFTKWDDQPGSLQHFAESTVRGYQIAGTAPRGPVLIVADMGLQEDSDAGKALVPSLLPTRAAVGNPAALSELAQWLIAAENPVILADRFANSHAGMPLLVKLAELLGAPVADLGARMNFPTNHPLNHSIRAKRLVGESDLILALEPIDLRGALTSTRDQVERAEKLLPPEGARIVTIGVDPIVRSNYQEFQRYFAGTLFIEGDGEATLPHLIEAVRKALTPEATRRAAARAADLADGWQQLRDAARDAAAVGWDTSPVSTARLCAEVWNAIRDEDWVLASPTWNVSGWPQRLWDMDKPHCYTGSLGAAGIGTSIATALGAALANRDKGRITVNIQADGDLLYAPGALWTAAHHRIPLLSVMHNNRAYHQEVMHLQRMATRHQRGIERVGIGTTITDPDIDFAQLARSMGVWATGPITDPAALPAALRRAVAVVKSGAPALVDVVCQGR